MATIAGTYHAWRGDEGSPEVRGRSRILQVSARLEEIKGQGYVLTPGRYVGTGGAEGDTEPFDKRINRLATTLRNQQSEAAKLDARIAANLTELGYGG